MVWPIHYYTEAIIMRKAFTLIELLVVIAILGILIGLLMPRIGGAIGFARESTCRANLKNLYQATMNHSIDNGGNLPYAGSYERVGNPAYEKPFSEARGWVAWIPKSGDNFPKWASEESHVGKMRDGGNLGERAEFAIKNGTLYGYTDRELSVYRCPVAARDSDFRARVWSRTSERSGIKESDPVRLSYVMNDFFYSQQRQNWYHRQHMRIGTSESVDYVDESGETKSIVPNASRLMLFAEDCGYASSKLAFGRNCALHIPDDDRSRRVQRLTDDFPRIGGFHRGGTRTRTTDGRDIPWGLVVFLDGHIEKVCPNIRASGSNTKNAGYLLSRGLDSPDKR